MKHDPDHYLTQPMDNQEAAHNRRVAVTDENVAHAMRTDNVYICCDDCLAKMPDVKLEDLKLYGRDN